jgi:hypothetical protein
MKNRYQAPRRPKMRSEKMIASRFMGSTQGSWMIEDHNPTGTGKAEGKCEGMNSTGTPGINPFEQRSFFLVNSYRIRT